MTGKLELIVGPMRSNKTAELLRRIETRREYAKQYVMLLKPSADTKAALADPTLIDKLARAGYPAQASSPKELGNLLRSDVVKWSAIIKAADIKVD